ncbi:MAG: hypothetical protein NVS3B26_26680 [Mycobacteriales bacterium]
MTPRAVAEKAAKRMARSTVHVDQCGHFAPDVEPYFFDHLADQLAFLTAHVPVGPMAEARAATDTGGAA